MKSIVIIIVSLLLMGCDQSLTISTQDGGVVIQKSAVASALLNQNEIQVKYLDGSVQTVIPFQLVPNPAWTQNWRPQWKVCMRNANRQTLTKVRIQARAQCAPPEKYIQNPLYAQTVVTQLR